jgi:CheY-like chemotaxis protein/Tfp pilus assembly protein PilZ
MKKPLVYLACEQVHRLGVESLLQRMGLNVEIYEKMPALLRAVRRRGPDLVFFDTSMLCGDDGHAAADFFKDNEIFVVLLGAGENTIVSFPHICLAHPLDPHALHQLLRDRIKNYSRLHVRIETTLPGLFAREKDSQFCEITNLSAGGAFIKTCFPLGAGGEGFRLYIPLLGMKRELELQSEVVFQVTPSEANNYQQGAGIRFRQPDAETTRHLEDFLRRASDNDAVPALLVGLPPLGSGGEEKSSAAIANGRSRRAALSH